MELLLTFLQKSARLFLTETTTYLKRPFFLFLVLQKKNLFFSVYFDNWIFASLQKKYQHIDHFLALFSFVTKQENVFR